jgi:CHASE3 domain sensor protein
VKLENDLKAQLEHERGYILTSEFTRSP